MKTNILLISGKKRSGKDSFGKYVSTFFKQDNKKIKKISFAEALKEQSYEDTKILLDRINNTIELFEQTFIGKVVKHFSAYTKIRKDLFTTKNDFGDGDKNLVSRSILELYGTNIFRDRVNKNYWINKTIDKIKEAITQNVDFIYLPDTRFNNEISIIKDTFTDCNVKVVRVNRPELIDTNNHISNIALDNFTEFDFIFNTNNLQDLLEDATFLFNEIYKK